MEANHLNETDLNYKSPINGSVDLQDWENSVQKILQKGNCYLISLLELQNLSLPLQLSVELKQLSSLCETITVVRRVTFWLPLVIGIPGNILALLTILRFPRSTGTFYLTLLTIFDWMALVTKATNVAMLTFNFFDSVSCKLIIMLTNFTGTYANWILVLICFERFITVLFPLKKNFYFTMRRARLVAIFVAVIIFLFCSAYFWLVKASNGCVPSDKEFHDKWVHVTTVIYSYLPSVLLLVMVLLIWRELKKIQKAREYIFCGEEGTNSAALTQQRLQEQAKTERCITMMLLFAAVTFVILTVPLCVVLAVDSSGIAEHSNFSPLYFELFLTIARALVALTHAVNFFIYFLSTERFRSNVRQLFHCLPYGKKPASPDRTVKTVETICS